MDKIKCPSVYVIDDDAGMRESLKALIMSAGYPVECFSSAEVFLDRADMNTPACALIDVYLKEMDGITLQKQLIANESRLAVIMMSAYGEINQAVDAMRMGAADFIEKPFDPDELLNRIAAVTAAADQAQSMQRMARCNAALLQTLTPREQEVLEKIVNGKANKLVASELGISTRTVETHRVHIMQKLKVESLAHVVRLWFSAQQAETIVTEHSK